MAGACQREARRTNVLESDPAPEHREYRLRKRRAPLDSHFRALGLWGK